MSEWRENRLEDITKLIIDCPHSTPKWKNDGVIVLRTQNIRNGRLDLSSPSYTDFDGYKSRIKRAIPSANDIVLTREAPMGEVCLIPDGLKCCLGQRMVLIRADEEELNSEFLLYSFQAPYLREQILWNEGTGTTVSNIRIPSIKDFVIKYPNPKEQKEIAKTLSNLDQKITLLRQQNQTMEELAQTLFERWFVEFEFPNENDEPYKCSGGKMVESELGEIPEGWRVGKLSELLEIKYGKDHKHLSEGRYPVYGSGGIMRYVSKSLYDQPSILLPRKGTLSNVFYLNQPFWSVDTMFYSKIKREEYGKYCFQLLKRVNLSLMDVGSAVPSLTTNVLNGMDILIPAMDVAKQFEETLSSLFNKMKTNHEEIQTLTQLRGTLLPKLMSGELKVIMNKKQEASERTRVF